MIRRLSALGVFLALLPSSAFAQLAVTPQNDPEILANEILGEGITIVPGSASFTGSFGELNGGIPGYSAGTFTGGMGAGIGMEAGIILSTGDVLLAPGPNVLDNSMWFNPSSVGDADLDALFVNPPWTKETAVLEFYFETASGNVSFNFVFASEEYNEYLWTGVPDVVGLFVNGENIALIPGTSTYVSIETVNGGGGNFDATPYGTGAVNPQFYNNNDPSDGGPFCNIEYDGFTDVFTAQKLDLGPGQHHLKLAIADVGDKEVDSAVFIQANSLTDEPRDEPLACNCSTPGLFYPPMNDDVTVKKPNRVLPLKLDLCDQSGNELTDADISAPMAEVDYIGPPPDQTFDSDDFLTAGQGDDSNLFVYSGSQWQLNLQTKMFDAPGVYRITVVSTDPDYRFEPACSVDFIIQ